MAADDSAPQYRVTGAYVTLKVNTPEGPQMRGFHQNAPVPPGVPQDQIDHHLSVGLIEPVDGPDSPPKARKAG